MVSAETQLGAAKKRIDVAEEGYQQSEIALKQAESNLEQLNKEYSRISYLYKEKAVTEKQFEQVENQLKSARFNVKNAISAVKTAETAKEQASISYLGSLKNYQLIKSNYENPTQLKQQIENAQTQVNVAEANVRIVKANLDKITQGPEEEDLAIARANVQQAEAVLDQIELSLKDAVIKSSIDGVIAAVNIEEREMAKAGIPLITIVKDDLIFVDIDVDPELVMYIQPKLKVEARIKMGSAIWREGKIDSISPVMDKKTQAYNVKVLLDNNDLRPKDGMLVDVKITYNGQENALVIPVEAVMVPILYTLFNKDNIAE